MDPDPIEETLIDESEVSEDPEPPVANGIEPGDVIQALGLGYSAPHMVVQRVWERTSNVIDDIDAYWYDANRILINNTFNSQMVKIISKGGGLNPAFK